MDMMKPVIFSKKRENMVMDHVLKCFTFGKPVRRTEPLVNDDASKLDDIKRKFNRIRLIRSFHSIKRENRQRKFDNPLDQLGQEHGR